MGRRTCQPCSRSPRVTASSIPEARLVVVQALGERHCRFDDLPSVLEELCKDQCEVVTVAARNLWAGLKDATETGMKEAEQDQDSEDDDEDDDDEGFDED